MTKTYLYIPDELNMRIVAEAKARKKSKAEVMRTALSRGLIEEKPKNGVESLLELAEIAKKYKVTGPRDLSINHDYYLWGGKKKVKNIK